jgi:hypothetical protein
MIIDHHDLQSRESTFADPADQGGDCGDFVVNWHDDGQTDFLEPSRGVQMRGGSHGFLAPLT